MNSGRRRAVLYRVTERSLRPSSSPSRYAGIGAGERSSLPLPRFSSAAGDRTPLCLPPSFPAAPSPELVKRPRRSHPADHRAAPHTRYPPPARHRHGPADRFVPDEPRAPRRVPAGRLRRAPLLRAGVRQLRRPNLSPPAGDRDRPSQPRLPTEEQHVHPYLAAARPAAPRAEQRWIGFDQWRTAPTPTPNGRDP